MTRQDAFASFRRKPFYSDKLGYLGGYKKEAKNFYVFSYVLEKSPRQRSKVFWFFFKEEHSCCLFSYRLAGKKFACAVRTLSVMKLETTDTRAWLFMSE